MPNNKVSREAARQRRRKRRSAEKAYQRYRTQVPALIRQMGTTQAAHDRAFDLLSKMGDTIVGPLLEALADPTLDPIAVDEVVSLLGAAGDPKAQSALWAFFEANRDDPERASTAVMSLAALGDERVLPYLRSDLRAGDAELVSNAVASLIFVGELEDVDRLRLVHLRFLTDREIRMQVSTAILSILDETDEATLKHKMDEIDANPAEANLTDDIWHILEQWFGPGARDR